MPLGFCDSLCANDVAFVYFAGHGIEADVLQNGKRPTSNWLLSTDLPQSNQELPRTAIDAKNVLSQMEARGTRLNVMVLDCCRDNPLPAEARALTAGLGGMEAARGSVIAFACVVGQLAAEFRGQPNSLYTKHLLRHLASPGVLVSEVFSRA